jgi:exosortase/archaeosortase family protein
MAVQQALVSRSLSRRDLVTTLFLLGVVNGSIADVVRSIVIKGIWAAAFDTFDVSVVVVIASVIGARFLLQSSDRDIDRADWIAIALYGLLLIVPHRAGSWIGLTLLALFEIARGPRTTSSLAAATIFLAIAVNKFWGAFLLQLFAEPIFEIDAAMTTAALTLMTGEGVVREGNVIHAGPDLALVVATGCSSVAGMSAALLCWITVTRALHPRWRRSELPAAVFVCVGVVGLNVFRIALMGLGPQWFYLVHGPIGANVFNVALLAVAAATALYTAKSTNAQPPPAA